MENQRETSSLNPYHMIHWAFGWVMNGKEERGVQIRFRGVWIRMLLMLQLSSSSSSPHPAPGCEQLLWSLQQRGRRFLEYWCKWQERKGMPESGTAGYASIWSSWLEFRDGCEEELHRCCCCCFWWRWSLNIPNILWILSCWIFSRFLWQPNSATAAIIMTMICSLSSLPLFHAACLLFLSFLALNVRYFRPLHSTQTTTISSYETHHGVSSLLLLCL